MGEWIKLTASDGHRFDGYFALPSGTARGGLVVIQEIFGVNRHMRSVADRFAADGYAALAPALFDRVERNVDVGYDEAGMIKGRSVRQRLTYDQAMLDTTAAVAHLQRSGKVGIVGYYGGDIANLLNETPKAPVMLHFGEKDQHIPATAVARIRAAAPTVPVHTYPAGHGFNCDERKDYDAASAAEARDRTLAFLATHIG